MAVPRLLFCCCRPLLSLLKVSFSRGRRDTWGGVLWITGKTLLAKTLARFVNVPFVIADATTLTQVVNSSLFASFAGVLEAWSCSFGHNQNLVSELFMLQSNSYWACVIFEPPWLPWYLFHSYSLSIYFLVIDAGWLCWWRCGIYSIQAPYSTNQVPMSHCIQSCMSCTMTIYDCGGKSSTQG